VNNTWKKTVTTVALSAALLTTAYPVWASDGANTSETHVVQNAKVSYTLNDSIEVEIKSILNEQTLDGSQLGAVVRLRNIGAKVTRVPDYELRVRTTEGVEYTLQPSSKNPKSIQPKAEQELSYLAIVDQADTVTLSQISWVDIDAYAYPKKETVLLTLPVGAGKAWIGSAANITDQTAIRKWGETFTLAELHSPIVYRTIDIHKENVDKSPVTVVQLEASNPTKDRQTIPAFTIEGKTDGNVFSGKRAEEQVTLEPDEKQYIHLIVPTDLDSTLTSLTIVTPEKFVSEAGEKAYNIGRLSILLPVSNSTAAAALPAYEYGKPFKLDALNKSIHPDMEVSLVELHMQENKGDGFQTAIAKFKLTNKSDKSLPVPSFQTELASKDGYVYPGSRQAATALQVVPNASYIVNYSFAMPSSESTEGLKISLYDKQVKPDYSYNSILAAYQVNAQPDGDVDALKVYPYDVKVTNWTFSSQISAIGTYSYKLKLLLDITQDKQVVTDANTSELQFDIYDAKDSLLGSTTKGFTGTGKLQSGANTVSINPDSEQLDYPLTVRIYESFKNESGEISKRLLTTYKQAS
jgi:hypothetical protein